MNRSDIINYFAENINLVSKLGCEKKNIIYNNISDDIYQAEIDKIKNIIYAGLNNNLNLDIVVRIDGDYTITITYDDFKSNIVVYLEPIYADYNDEYVYDIDIAPEKYVLSDIKASFNIKSRHDIISIFDYIYNNEKLIYDLILNHVSFCNMYDIYENNYYVITNFLYDEFMNQYGINMKKDAFGGFFINAEIIRNLKLFCIHCNHEF